MFKNIDLLVKHAISFALYRLPNQQEPILIIGKKAETKSTASIVELNDMSGFVVAPFKPTAHTPIVCIQPEKIIKGSENIAEYLQGLSFPDNETEDSNVQAKCEDYYPAYKKAFDAFIDVLLTRRFQKLVLSRPFEYENTNKVPLGHILKKALDAYPTSFVYLCSTPQTGVWLGSSPELLLEGQGDKWKTVALAGTQSVEDTLTNYSWDNKNRYEQQLVTDYIKQLLDSLKLEYVQDNDSHTVKIGKLIHLKTGFSFQLNDSISVGELLDKLHPTPAICGLPKAEAYDFIVKNEGYDRSYYSGFVGYLDRGQQTNLYVNLRCMKVEPEYFRLYAGGGLLPTSELNSEWEETNAKLQTMLSLLK